MAPKRTRTEEDDSDLARPTKTKRPRCNHHDFLSPLSDELLVRILTFLPLQHLLNVAPVSKRLNRLSEDSQVWKRLYYLRFVLPRASRIPGFRDGSARAGKLHYSSRKAIWADGRRGGWVDLRSEDGDRSRNWKRQYKLRHNWSRGKCAVEELKVGQEMAAVEPSASRKMLVKVSEGIAVTADAVSGLRAWDLKTKQLLVHSTLSETQGEAAPNCLAIDDQELQSKNLDIAVGFTDGSFGVWKLHVKERKITRKYQHQKSSNGELVAVAFSYPYLLTATESVIISLYTFDGPRDPEAEESETERSSGNETARDSIDHTETELGRYPRTSSRLKSRPQRRGETLSPPYLLTSLKSYTSRAPLALSIRKTAGATIASIAYTFSTLQGWFLGIQDLHLRPPSSTLKTTPDITNTRLAYSLPVKTTPSRFLSRPSTSSGNATLSEEGPTNICYSHPYLLGTLPDNTLILYLCTSNASSLSISPGIRLWGHTSGISDAEITARGKAVSVSCRGEEIRVWELEGRPDGRSIKVRPTASETADKDNSSERSPDPSRFDEKRNWVGFDDEMVIVLKESREGRESLMVYDFT